MERKNNSSGFWVGMFLGAILSVILLVLAGTKEGRLFAKRMKRRIEGQIDQLEHEMEKEGGVIDRAEELKEKAAKKGQDVASKIGNKLFRKQGKS